MSRPGTPNPWSEINGGMRGSILLYAGAATTLLATAQNFAADFMMDPPGMLISSAWLCWVMALLLLAAGFIWTGVHPFLGRIGLIVGGFHLLNGLFLFAVLFLGMKPFLPNVSLSIGRTLFLLIFVLMEKQYLRKFSVVTMMVVSFLHFLKISLRIMDILPSFGKYADSALDSTLLALLAVTIIIVGRDINFVEEKWARELAANRSSGFTDFNNPEHDWNRDKD